MCMDSPDLDVTPFLQSNSMMGAKKKHMGLVVDFGTSKFTLIDEESCPCCAGTISCSWCSCACLN